MPVGLTVMIDENRPMAFWDNFLDAQESHENLDMDKMLAKWGAYTNWDDWSDPVWFTDQECLAAFLLAWS